ncbi:trichohyalin isoform X1 [Phthorimaea operculella]|nr:trichohyalin isoform X1 [Phthorimaea operculella]
MGTKTPFCPQLPRNNRPPNDGPGPRGFPDCYYVSRTLDSTFRYVRFVKKLRAIEEEQRKGRENNLKALKDRQISDFFNRCDRRALINNVARRVDLCMRSYERDLEEKKKKLKWIFEEEDRDNIRKVVVQAQAATETIWQEKLARLKYLLEKRRLEHEKKYKKRPLSKCTHVRHCIINLRNKEAHEFHQYQMREKEAMKMQELEFDRMWHELGMKESDALYQMREKEAMKMQELEFDRIWHELGMKESDALYQMQEREAMKMQELEFDRMWHELGMKESDALYQMRLKEAMKMQELEFDRMWHELRMKESDALVRFQQYGASFNSMEPVPTVRIQFHQYQMREKEAMKMQELEFDRMWHELRMKESDALVS